MKLLRAHPVFFLATVNALIVGYLLSIWIHPRFVWELVGAIALQCLLAVLVTLAMLIGWRYWPWREKGGA